MSSLESNRETVIHGVAGLVEGWNFTVAGEEKSLGQDLIATTAQAIQERSVPDATDPDGGTWAANEPRYARYKQRKYDAHQPNIRTGQMLSLKSLIGESTVTADEVLMRYGTGQSPDSAFNGTELTRSDREITDIEKAWFASRNRPFYAIDDEIIDLIGTIAGESLDQYMEQD